MHLEDKELCGKNVYFIKKPDRLSMYHHDKKVGEIELNEDGNVITLKAYSKQYVKNLIYYINLHKELLIEDIKGFPCKYSAINPIKERLHPDIILRYAIMADSVILAKYAIEREAVMNKETFVSSCMYSHKILYLHIHSGICFIEEGMEAAFEHKNYDCIKLLSMKTNCLEKYIELCNQKDEYQVIKNLLVKSLVQRNKNAK